MWGGNYSTHLRWIRRADPPASPPDLVTLLSLAIPSSSSVGSESCHASALAPENKTNEKKAGLSLSRVVFFPQAPLASPLFSASGRPSVAASRWKEAPFFAQLGKEAGDGGGERGRGGGVAVAAATGYCLSLPGRPGISADPWRDAAECRPGLRFGVPFYFPEISGRGGEPLLLLPFLGNFFHAGGKVSYATRVRANTHTPLAAAGKRCHTNARLLLRKAAPGLEGCVPKLLPRGIVFELCARILGSSGACCTAQT